VLSLGVAVAFCVVLTVADPPRFDRAIARWHALFVLEAGGITADEAAFALSAAKGWLAPRLATLPPGRCANSRRRMGLERSYSPCVERTVTDGSVTIYRCAGAGLHKRGCLSGLLRFLLLHKSLAPAFRLLRDWLSTGRGDVCGVSQPTLTAAWSGGQPA
jgi:hypothetical protein